MRAKASGYSGGLRVDARFFSEGITSDQTLRGVCDRIEDLAHPGIDVGAIDPRVVAFFVDTAGLDLWIRSHWRFPFNLLWKIGFHLARAMGQFVYPRREGWIRTRAFALDRARDGRADARAILRTYVDDGAVMQAAAYATWERAGTRLMSACFPLPFSRVMGMLRMDPIAGGGVVLTSAAKNDDAGVWLVVGPLAIPTPLGESMALWPPGAPHAHDAEPPPAGAENATLLGRHEQRLFGIRMVTHHYWFAPSTAS